MYHGCTVCLRGLIGIHCLMQELFEDLVLRDEFQLEGMDVLSNILYMKEDFATLSHLAHKAVLIDKYRPETCCIVGNYYSLKGQHEKVCSPTTRDHLFKLDHPSDSTRPVTAILFTKLENISSGYIHPAIVHCDNEYK